MLNRNFTTISLVLVFSFHLVMMGDLHADQTNNSLQITKTELEIEKLKKDIETTGTSGFIQLGTLIIALLAATISFWSAWRSQISNAKALQAQTEASRKDRVSQLLKELGSEKAEIRSATVQALSEYPSALPYIINLLNYESDIFVIETVNRVISSNHKAVLDLLLENSRVINNRRVTNAGTLFAVGLDMEFVEKATLITKSYFTRWKDSAIGKRHIGSIQQHLEVTDDSNKAAELELLKADAVEQSHSLTRAYGNLLHGIELGLREKSNDGEIFILENAYLVGSVLDEYDISGWEFKNCILIESSFKNCLAVGCKFIDCELDNATFKGADIRDSQFINCTLNSSSFVKSKLIRSLFNGVKAYKASFFMAKINKANFANASLVQTNYEKSIGEDVSFEGAALMGANFNEAIISRANFKEARLDGAVLTNMKANDCNLEEASINGVTKDGSMI